MALGWFSLLGMDGSEFGKQPASGKVNVGISGLSLWEIEDSIIPPGGAMVQQPIIQVPRERSQLTLLLNVTDNGAAGGGSGVPAVFFAWFEKAGNFDPNGVNPWDGRAPGALVPYFNGTESFYMAQFPALGPTMAFTLANFGPANITIAAALTAAKMR